MRLLKRDYVVTAIARLYDCMAPTPVPINRIETKSIVGYWKDDHTIIFEVDTRDYYSDWKEKE